MGNLDTAIRNARHSMDEKKADGRNYTYSELGHMIEELKALLKIRLKADAQDSPSCTSAFVYSRFDIPLLCGIILE